MKKIKILGFLFFFTLIVVDAQEKIIDTTTGNNDDINLTDGLEQLPDMQYYLAEPWYNYTLNEAIVLKTYNRYHFDIYGVASHTIYIEIPVKISDKFSLYPSYRHYTQTSADYFVLYEDLQSNNNFSNSDFDLLNFYNNQFSFALSYTNDFTRFNLGQLELKNIDLKFNRYNSVPGLNASYVAMGFNFAIDD